MNNPPSVVRWYKVYATFMVSLYVLLTLALVVILALSAKTHRTAITPFEWVYLIILSLVSLVLAGVFLTAFFLPRKPWVWIYHLVLICLGLSSPCLLPACVPLLIFITAVTKPAS